MVEATDAVPEFGQDCKYPASKELAEMDTVGPGMFSHQRLDPGCYLQMEVVDLLRNNFDIESMKSDIPSF